MLIKIYFSSSLHPVYPYHYHYTHRNCSCTPYLDVGDADHALDVLHVLAQIVLDKLEDQSQNPVCVDDVVQGDHVRMAQVAQKAHLTDRRARRTLVVLKPNFLNAHTPKLQQYLPILSLL